MILDNDFPHHLILDNDFGPPSFHPPEIFFIYLEQGEKYVMKEPPQEI